VGVQAEWNISVTILGMEGLEARLARGGKKARAAILAVVGESASRMHQRTHDLCPKDTFYMSEHIRTDFSKGGFVFETGWDAKDFLGHKNPVTKQIIRAFYPFYVEFGTRTMSAQPSLSIAYREEAPKYKAALERALRRALND
jgi:HK97 gp10 family phage protein